MKKSDAINELATALAIAQGEIRGALKDSENPHFRSKYADLASVWDACRVPLSKNKLCVIQTMGTNEESIVLETMIAHSSGQWISGEYPINPDKPGPQPLASAVTYARRYSLMSIVGIAPDDDDGNAATGKELPGVYPSDPGTGNGSREVQGYLIPNGTFARKRFHEIDTKELRDYIARKEKLLKVKPAEEPFWWEEFIKQAEGYLADLELNYEKGEREGMKES